MYIYSVAVWCVQQKQQAAENLKCNQNNKQQKILTRLICGIGAADIYSSMRTHI